VKPFPEIPNCELYLVGGSVRDHLLGLKTKDRDFVVLTELSFDELVKTIDAMPDVKVFLAKPEFLTIRCIIKGEPIDIAFPRTDGSYTDRRHPDSVIRVNELYQDSQRRDFTINALYMSKTGEVIDYWGGKQDLERKLIKCVGDPYGRFQEDALRILRAIRFSAKLDFDIYLGTWLEMQDQSDLLHHISAERIREELNIALRIDAGRTIAHLERLFLFDLLKEKGLHFELSSAK
jgi:tRNA nucleotidyltransferase (CCA-adding enzyme)